MRKSRTIRTSMVAALAFSGFAPVLAVDQTAVQRTPAVAQQPVKALGVYGIPKQIKVGPLVYRGTCITYMMPGSKADRAGLRRLDMIYTVNKIKTPDPAQLNKVLEEHRRFQKSIEFFRHDGQRYNVATAFVADGQALVTSRVLSRGQQQAKRLPQAELEDYMLLLINGDRAKNGLTTTLKKSSALGRMARNYAEDMAKRNFHGHTDPEGRDPWQRARLAGINSINIREVCSYPYAQADCKAMVATGQEDFMNSPEHKVAVVAADNVCVGVGIAYRADGGLMCVQVYSPDDIP